MTACSKKVLADQNPLRLHHGLADINGGKCETVLRRANGNVLLFKEFSGRLVRRRVKSHVDPAVSSLSSDCYASYTA